ncbi:MAG: PKD domain-containing protein, partial [Candidatus Hydrogenedentes bacterium]|nr:PKD domain-containing protein [Candidatus Hydrogenedentota bacterium]
MNVRFWSVANIVMLGGVIAVTLTGCPKAPTAALALIVSPESLDFGARETSLTLKVRKNYTRLPLGVFRVSSNASWVTVDPATGTSSGPNDPATITVTVNRDLMSVGTNHALIGVTAEGASRVEIPVQAVRQITAAFSVSNNAVFTGDLLEFTDLSQTVSEAPPIVMWEWDFGDGSTSSEQNPTHAYGTAGSYDLSLTVSNDDETATLTRRDYISVEAKVPPSVEFIAEPMNAAPGEGIQFMNLSEAGTSPITSYSWSFGDGNSSTEENPVHTYAEVGTYDVTLTVKSDHGQGSTTKYNYITISPVAPEAAFSVDSREPVLGPSGARVQFTDQSQQGTSDIISWYWEFGDGDTSEEKDPSHLYTRPGRYTVSLTVTARNGQTDTETIPDYIEVIETTLIADFSADTQNAWVDQAIQFTDTSVASPAPVTQWSWDFGDGNGSTQSNPTHAYSEEGIYTVSLTVTNPYGTDTEVKTDYITVSRQLTLTRYIFEAGPPSYTVNTVLSAPYEGQTLTLHILDLKSQTFRQGDVVPAQWQ